MKILVIILMFIVSVYVVSTITDITKKSNTVSVVGTVSNGVRNGYYVAAALVAVVYNLASLYLLAFVL